MRRISTVVPLRDLTKRRSVTIDLPEFLLAALEQRVAEANASSSRSGEDVSLEHLVELELAETLSVGEVALLERKVPGISAAVSRWLSEIE
jgi:hypothetical protein